jgi:hypothetical protein
VVFHRAEPCTRRARRRRPSIHTGLLPTRLTRPEPERRATPATRTCGSPGAGASRDPARHARQYGLRPASEGPEACGNDPTLLPDTYRVATASAYQQGTSSPASGAAQASCRTGPVGTTGASLHPTRSGPRAPPDDPRACRATVSRRRRRVPSPRCNLGRTPGPRASRAEERDTFPVCAQPARRPRAAGRRTHLRSSVDDQLSYTNRHQALIALRRVRGVRHVIAPRPRAAESPTRSRAGSTAPQQRVQAPPAHRTRAGVMEPPERPLRIRAVTDDRYCPARRGRPSWSPARRSSRPREPRRAGRRACG